MAKKKNIKTKKAKKRARKVKKAMKPKRKTKRRTRKKNPPRQTRKRRLPPSSRRAKLRRTSRQAKSEIIQEVLPVRDYKRKKKKQRKQVSNGVHRPKIKVIGIGGGGGSIINEIAPQMTKIDFLVANTDLQALNKLSKKTKRFSFGRNLTGGLGTGMNPKLGELAAQSESDRIKKIMEGQDLCIFVSCLGGGTGSGASPLFAKIAREIDVLTLGIFTMPFKFEGSKKMKVAKSALRTLKNELNAVAIIPNQSIFKIIDQKTPLRKALSSLNKILAENLKGLIDFVYWPGLINIDFADLRTILEGRSKKAYLNSVRVQGKNRVEEGVEKVLASPLYRYGIEGSDRILFNIEGGRDLKMSEVEQISKKIYEFNPRAKIIFGVAQYPRYKNKIKITLLAVAPGKEEKKLKKKAFLRVNLEKDVIGEKLDLSLEKISRSSSPEKQLSSVSLRRKIRPRKKKKIKKINPKKRTKKASLKKKIIGKKVKKIKKANKKILKPNRKTVPAPKTLEKKIKPESAKPKIKKQIEESVEKEFGSVLAAPASYNEVLNAQRETEKIRKNALDIKREAEEVEKEIEKKERKWDIPAFLRRKKTNL